MGPFDSSIQSSSLIIPELFFFFSKQFRNGEQVVLDTLHLPSFDGLLRGVMPDYIKQIDST